MKRFFDFTVSLLLIMALIPVFLIIALVVLIDSGYPVIFKQYRVGKDNKLFYIYKFRTMSDDKDEYGNLLSDEVKGVIAIITKNTKKASGQLWEIKCAKEEKIPVLPPDINESLTLFLIFLRI